CILALVFLLGEFLRRHLKVSPEVSRKTVHIGGCIVALLFPSLLDSHWSVLLMAAAATAMIVIGKRRRMLPSLDDVQRETRGSIYHPIAIYVCFLTAQMLHRMVYFEIAMLVLGLSDSMAALTGVAYGKKKYLVEATDSKSVEGSVAFFVITFIIVEISLLLFTPISRLDCILVALLIAVFVTMFEAISMHGADNLAVPLGTIFILAKNIDPVTLLVLRQFIVLAFAMIYVIAIAYPFKKVSSTGVISMALGIYTAGGLVNYNWMLPMMVATFAFCRTQWFVPEDTQPNRARPAFYLLVVPIFWILGANLLGKIMSPNEASFILFPSFITSVICQMLISRHNRSVRRKHPYGFPQLLRDTILFNIPILLGVAVLHGADMRQPLVWCCLIGVAFENAVVLFYDSILQRRVAQESCNLLRLRMLLVLAASFIPAAAMMFWRMQWTN
ncbi:MAG: phosphatidate cytidylyltransferase, partial [Victivallales bacterium]|nr:phosphatidate cytidylyltransferase [Victivallales bacterium]